MSFVDSTLATLEGAADKFLPAATEKCGLTSCTPGKVYLVLAILGILTSMTSWGTFVSSVVWEVVIGALIIWLCRSCRNKFVWAIVVLSAALPLLFFVLFILGLVAAAGTAILPKK